MATDFATHFRDHVGPRLRRECRLHGLRVAFGDECYGEAYDTVIHVAVRLGALHLPTLLWDDMQDTVGRWLCEVIAGALPIAEESERIAERVAIDLAQYFRAWEQAQVRAA
jgi:hypothetical protein